MAEKFRWVMYGVVGLLALAILILSVDVRVDGEGPARLPAFAHDPSTGAILVDLDDDTSSSERDRIEELLGRAIAPSAWPSGDAAMGETLSDEAQLYRISPPASEVADVLSLLDGAEDVEGVEVERTWSLPDGAEAFAIEADFMGSAIGPAPEDGGETFVPNDPHYRHQWHLDQIQMPRAWTQQRGKGAVVAVIDTGVSYRDAGRFKRAPDLANTTIVDGWDFVDGDATPDDEHGHGTHCAGTVAQSTNNAIGVAGVAPEAAIMPLRVLDKNGSGHWGGIAAAIRWAADHDANVISMSLGGGMPSNTVARAIQYAHGKGVTVIAAAGNASRARVEYPAAHAHVIAVGAVRYDETLTFYSSYGRGLDLVAPGGDLRVDQNGDGLPDGVLQNTILRGDPSRHDYVAWQGTSMATPHVAGVAALIHAAGVRDPDTIEQVLLRSAKKKDDTRKYGAGLLQASDALALAERGLGGLRGGLALGFGALLLLGLRRRNQLGTGRAAALGVAFAVAGGLALLPLHGVPGAGAGLAEIAEGLPTSLAEGLPAWAAPVLLSTLIPLGLAALFLGFRRMTPVVVGTAIAFAAWLTLEALVPTTTIGLLPDALVGPWLLANAVIAALIARFAAIRPSSGAR